MLYTKEIKEYFVRFTLKKPKIKIIKFRNDLVLFKTVKPIPLAKDATLNICWYVSEFFKEGWYINYFRTQFYHWGPKEKTLLTDGELLKYKLLFVTCADPWIEEEISVITKFSFFERADAFFGKECKYMNHCLFEYIKSKKYTGTEQDFSHLNQI